MAEAVESIQRTLAALGRWFQSSVQDCSAAFARIGEPIEPYVGPPLKLVYYGTLALALLVGIGFAALIALPFALIGTALGYVKHVARETEEELQND